MEKRGGKMDSQLLLDLYRRQAKIIFGYLIKNGCTKEESEDIIQNSFVKAIEHMDGVSKEKLPSWLFMVAINEEEFFNNFSKEDDFTEELLLKEKQDEVKNCLDKLKSGNKNLLILRYEMGLSYKEISVLLGSKDTKMI